MTSLNEANWIRLEHGETPSPEHVKTMQVFCSFPGSAGTQERLLVDAAGLVYRERSWSGRHGSGSVWFKLYHLREGT